MKAKLLVHEHLTVKKSPIHGYGVFAQRDFNSKEIIEECHVLLIPLNYSITKTPPLDDYLFICDQNQHALPLGFGSIYNHSDTPNTTYILDEEKAIMTFSATKTIRIGEEIFVSYGEEWFKSRQMQVKKAPLGWKHHLKKCSLFLRMLITVSGIYGIIYTLKG